jgi:RecB family exonuclease
LSFSAVRAYQSCPLRYFFRYVAGLPEHTVSASLIFGAAVHRAIEHHFRELLVGNPPPTVEELLAEYHGEWQQRDVDPVRLGRGVDLASLTDLAQRLLTAFLVSDVARPQGTILAIEEELRGGVIPGLPDLLGSVDLIVETPEELVIKDWKTSRSRWSTEQVDEAAEQLLLYSELVGDFAPGKPVRMEFAVLTKTKEVAIQRHSKLAKPQQVDRMKRVVEQVWRAIEAEHFYPAPTPLACGGWCPSGEAA